MGKKDGNIRETPRLLGIQMHGFATDGSCAGGNRRRPEGDDRFRFRRVGSYMTQAFAGLQCSVKVKGRNREVGITITEDEFTTGA